MPLPIGEVAPVLVPAVTCDVDGMADVGADVGVGLRCETVGSRASRPASSRRRYMLEASSPTMSKGSIASSFIPLLWT